MRNLLVLVISVIFLCGCATTLSSLQRRSIESRDLEGLFDDAFKATLQVFQDYGFMITHSDYQGGVILGKTGAKPDFWYTHKHMEATANLEQFGDGVVKERIIFIKKKGEWSKRSEIVEDPEFLQRVYDDIQKEMFVRSNLGR